MDDSTPSLPPIEEQPSTAEPEADKPAPPSPASASPGPDVEPPATSAPANAGPASALEPPATPAPASVSPALATTPPAQPTALDMQTAMARAGAQNRGFTGNAILALILTLVFWPIGFIYTWILRNDVKKTTSLAGASPSGAGCIGALFWFNIVWALATIALVLVMCGGIAASGR